MRGFGSNAAIDRIAWPVHFAMAQKGDRDLSCQSERESQILQVEGGRCEDAGQDPEVPGGSGEGLSDYIEPIAGRDASPRGAA